MFTVKPQLLPEDADAATTATGERVSGGGEWGVECMCVCVSECV